jgi:hypothetical protein
VAEHHMAAVAVVPAESIGNRSFAVFLVDREI